MEIKPNVANSWAALRPALETMCKSNLPLDFVQEMLVKTYIEIALKQNHGNKSAAGKAIKVHRNTIYRYMGNK